MALVVKYLTGRFIWEYQSDFDWKYSYQTVIDGEQVHIEIIDSLTMDDSHIRWAEGFLAVYDITSPQSLRKMEEIRRRIEQVRASHALAMIVVGNKCDLEHCRCVAREHAAQVSTRLSASGHVECSACGPESDVRFAFDELCREVANVRMRSAQKRERRRSSLSQVRQGLKMLVNTGKQKTLTVVNGGAAASVGAGGSNSPNGSGGGSKSSGRRVARFGSQSPFSSIMSAPVLNDLPEDEHHPEQNLFMRKFFDAAGASKQPNKPAEQLSREPSTDSGEFSSTNGGKKSPIPSLHRRSLIGGS